MSLRIETIDAVVIAHWNLAILSPQWIASELLSVPLGQQVPVLVSMDYAAPNRIQSEKLEIEIRPYSDKLHIVSLASNFSQLQRCMQVADKAITALPVTPVFAVGINVNLSQDQDTEQDRIAEILASPPLDRACSELGLSIRSRSTTRKLDWKGGELNLAVAPNSTGGYSARFNFHMNSSDRGILSSWLSQPTDDLESMVRDIASRAFECPVLEAKDDTD